MVNSNSLKPEARVENELSFLSGILGLRSWVDGDEQSIHSHSHVTCLSNPCCVHSLHLVISGGRRSKLPVGAPANRHIDKQIHYMQVNSNDKADPSHVSYLSSSFLIYQMKNLDCSKIADFHGWKRPERSPMLILFSIRK